MKKQIFGMAVTLLVTLSLCGCNENTDNVHNQANDNNNRNGDSNVINPSDTFSIITPYVNENDISEVRDAYGINESNPWGFGHPGIDFMITKDQIPVQAAVNGTICCINISKSSYHMGWHAGFCIKFNSTWSVGYNLETCSQSDEISQKVIDNFLIHDGQFVHKGDIIGNLIYGGDGAHIDFGVSVSENTRICPEPFFTQEARDSVLRLIHKDHPDWCMCYPTTNPSNQINQPTTPSSYENLSMITPYVNESDINSVSQGYSPNASNSCWGGPQHVGIDFMITKDHIPVQAVINGTIVIVNISKGSGDMGWHALLGIEFNSTTIVCCNLETFSQSDDIGQKLRENVFVSEGQFVHQGDIIANMVYGGSDTHIDFGISILGNRVCPEPFFTEAARASVMRLIQKDHPDWPMCCD